MACSRNKHQMWQQRLRPPEQRKAVARREGRCRLSGGIRHAWQGAAACLIVETVADHCRVPSKEHPTPSTKERTAAWRAHVGL